MCVGASMKSALCMLTSNNWASTSTWSMICPVERPGIGQVIISFGQDKDQDGMLSAKSGHEQHAIVSNAGHGQGGREGRQQGLRGCTDSHRDSQCAEEPGAEGLGGSRKQHLSMRNTLPGLC